MGRNGSWVVVPHHIHGKYGKTTPKRNRHPASAVAKNRMTVLSKTGE
jgi:hypothetical protein